MEIYGVLDIDLVNSRSLTNRIEIQEELKKYMKELTYKYRNLLVSSITFTLGDELQVVLNEPKESYNIFKEIQDYLLKKKILCYGGLGIGTIDTKISEDTREMDGKVFIYARKAIDIAKESNRFYSDNLNSRENRFFFNGEEITFGEIGKNSFFREVAITSSSSECILTLNKLINTLIENNEVIENRFTEKQREVIYLYEKYGSYNAIINKNSEFSKAGISQKLNTSNYFLTIHNKGVIRELLETYTIELRRN